MIYIMLLVYLVGGFFAQQYFMSHFFNSISSFLLSANEGLTLFGLWLNFGKYLIPAIFAVTGIMHLVFVIRKNGMNYLVDDVYESNDMISKGMEK